MSTDSISFLFPTTDPQALMVSAILDVTLSDPVKEFLTDSCATSESLKACFGLRKWPSLWPTRPELLWSSSRLRN